MKHLTSDDITQLTVLLENEKQELEASLAEHGRKVGGDWQGTAAGFESDEADETDTADKMEELATNVPLVETLESRLVDVTDALMKIEKGTYGMDEKTGEAISIERLRANPSARTAL